MNTYTVNNLVELLALSTNLIDNLYKGSYRKSVEEQIAVVDILMAIVHRQGPEDPPSLSKDGVLVLDVKNDSPFFDYTVESAKQTIPFTKNGPPIGARRTESQSTTSKRKAYDSDNDPGPKKAVQPQREITNPLLNQAKKRRKQQLDINPQSHSQPDTPITTHSRQSLATGPPPSKAPSSTGTSVAPEPSDRGYAKFQSDLVLAMGTAHSRTKKAGNKGKGKDAKRKAKPKSAATAIDSDVQVIDDPPPTVTRKPGTSTAGPSKRKAKPPPKSAETITDSDVEIIDDPPPTVTRKPGTSTTTATSKPGHRQKPLTKASQDSPSAMDLDDDHPPLPTTRIRGRSVGARGATMDLAENA
ncbi:hypothetical protein DFP72DRAFT_1073304 [Ephemerocybe angulata]|uniref:Uncharacterized protein n=1 Tax=Ephemerocybe angulata TaxID=980116 RepID=A0A8H6M071_9AGAR|nr:hypothetical protein DFP72DRAFT_1073304 [Tulosesus angulatus]